MWLAFKGVVIMAINSLTPSNKGMSGLVSGMDTQTMVDQMLKGTQAKIDAQKSKKAVLEYKQEMYRNIATQIKTFQQTFFSFSKPESNILSNSFFQSMTAASNSKFFTAKASSSASVGSVKINEIKQLATSHKEVSSKNATGELAGKFSQDALDKIVNNLTDPDKANVTINIGSGDTATKVDIKMTDLIGKSSSESVDIINQALRAAGENVTADFVDGRVILTSPDKKEMSVEGGENLPGVVSGTQKAEGAIGFILDTKAVLPKINVNVDGISKSISFNPLEKNAGETDQQSIVRQLNAGIKNAFGNGVSFSINSGKIKLDVTNSTSTVSVMGDQATLGVIGMKNNMSNKIATGSSIKDVNFAEPISGDMQKFSINGVDFSFSSGTSISNIIGKINSSAAGVKMSYDSTRDRFMIESTTSGAKANGANGTPFEMKQTEGNILSAMFGASPSGTYSSQNLSVKEIRTSSTFNTSGFDFTADSVSISLKKGDKTESFTIAGLTDSTDPAAVVAELNKKLQELPDFKNEDGTFKGEFKLTNNGDGTQTIELKATDTAAKATVVGEGMAAFGMTSVVSGKTLMSELGIESFNINANGRDIAINADMTVDEFMQTLKTQGLVSDAKLETIGTTPFIRLAGVGIPMTFPEPAASQLFGTKLEPGDGTVDSSMFSKDAKDGYVAGQNAIATVDGVEIERSTNTFTEKGITITLTGTTNEEQTVNVTQNTDQIFDTVKKFVEEYNKLINEVNGLLDAEATYRKYDPLTTEQKNEMSDKEIEIWEGKAKGGLLRNDSTLQNIKNSLRSTLYTKPDASGYALNSLGITTDYFGTKDNLVIQDGNEAKLREMIDKDPDAVRRLFTDPEKGLSTLLDKAMTKAAGSKGSIAAVAGSSSSDRESSIYRQMKQIDDNLDRLDNTYNKEYQRYWNSFNAMEQQLAKMNQQSSWLSQQLGG